MAEIVDRKAEEREIHPVENGGGGEDIHPVGFAPGGETDPQMLKDIPNGINIKCLKDMHSSSKDVKEKKETKEKEVFKDPKYPCNMFYDFWILYPRKTDKPKAWTAWIKLSPADRESAIEGVKAWNRLWNTFKDDEKAFIIYPERFIKNRRFDAETISTDLAQKLKARMVPGSGNKQTMTQIDENKAREAAARKRQEEQEELDEKKRKESKAEAERILQYFQALSDAEVAKVEKEVADLLESTGIARMREKFPRIYEDSRRSKIVQIVRPMYESFACTA